MEDVKWPEGWPQPHFQLGDKVRHCTDDQFGRVGLVLAYMFGFDGTVAYWVSSPIGRGAYADCELEKVE